MATITSTRLPMATVLIMCEAAVFYTLILFGKHDTPNFGPDLLHLGTYIIPLHIFYLYVSNITSV
jgi:hypothetical protein